MKKRRHFNGAWIHSFRIGIFGELDRRLVKRVEVRSNFSVLTSTSQEFLVLIFFHPY